MLVLLRKETFLPMLENSVDGVKSHLNLAILVPLTVIYRNEKLYFVDYKLLASKDEKGHI